MSGRLETSNPVEGMRVSLAAHKAMVSDYSLRARQAEAMVSVLMNEKIPQEVFVSTVVNSIKEHMTARGMERSTQYLGLLQTTLLSLTNLQRGLKTLPQEQVDEELITIIKALTLAVNPT